MIRLLYITVAPISASPFFLNLLNGHNDNVLVETSKDIGKFLISAHC